MFEAPEAWCAVGGHCRRGWELLQQEGQHFMRQEDGHFVAAAPLVGRIPEWKLGPIELVALG
eukprot:10342599-Lingulodinium_polyedra.AAC.2